MKQMTNGLSLRFMAGILISAGILPVMFFCYQHLETNKEQMGQIAFSLVFCLLLISWFVILRNARRAEEALLEGNRQLFLRTKELEELNCHLEERIKERTQSLVNLQTQLSQSERFSAIGHLAAGIAHEINNPIGFISSNLQTLQQYVVHYTRLLGILNKLEKALRDKDTQRAAELVSSWEKIRNETNFAFIGGDINNLLKESQEGAQKIGRIVSDLRTFASPDRGTVAAVDIEALLESVLNIVHNEIKYKAQVKREYHHPPYIVCNPQKIGRVFVNLLMNAAQAIGTKGVITIRTYIQEDFVCIDIMDSGCGIAPENFSQIFNPLFTTKAPGTAIGLGLSLSYDIVRKHDGNITFNSQLGQGTTFSVRLPLVAPVANAGFTWRPYERD